MSPPPSRRGPAVLNAPAPSPYCGKSCCIHHCQAPSLNKFECTEPWAAVSIISLSSLNISLTFFFQISFYPTVSPFHLPPQQPSSVYSEDRASRVSEMGRGEAFTSFGICGFPLMRPLPGTCGILHWRPLFFAHVDGAIADSVIPPPHLQPALLQGQGMYVRAPAFSSRGRDPLPPAPHYPCTHTHQLVYCFLPRC